jgi:hypothetical protein
MSRCARAPNAARAALACVALLACSLVLAGCLRLDSSSPAEATFNCDRGFRVADWNSKARLKTGQSIAKCGWLNGWPEARVRRVLGGRDFGTPLAPEYVLPGGEDASRNLRQWLLKLEFARGSRQLKTAKTETMPV